MLDTIDSDTTIFRNTIDEKGNVDLITTRDWHRDYYISRDGDVGSIITGTVDTPSVPGNGAPIYGPSQYNITSLTNVGGTRRRVVSGVYTRYKEDFYYIPPAWPDSEIGFDGFQVDYTADLTVKNPFDTDTYTLSLKSWEHLNGYWSGACEGTEIVGDSVWPRFFSAAGIRNNNFMVVFYMEFLKTRRTTVPCAREPYSGAIYKCEAPLPINWYNDCYAEAVTTELSSWPFKIKAFSQKVIENSDTMDMNPFELPEDNDLAVALKNVRDIAVSNPRPKVNPDLIEMYTRVFLKFIDVQ